MGYKILNKCMNLKVNYNTFRIRCIMLILEKLQNSPFKVFTHNGNGKKESIG